MKVYILYSYGYDEQRNIKVFIKNESALALLNKCFEYETNNPCPIWAENHGQTLEDHEEKIAYWSKRHPAKQTEAAGLGFGIDELSLVK
jgi:hypothetical protein